jgi:Phosphotransferase enzyme family
VAASRDGLGPFYQDVIAVSPLEPWDAASAAYRLDVLARTLPFPVRGARLVPSNNNDVRRLETGYLAELGDAMTADREVLLHGDCYLGNVLVHGDRVTALIDLEFARMGPRDLELISVVRALDSETRLGIRRLPPARLAGRGLPAATSRRRLVLEKSLTIGAPGWSAWRK